jgi:hypothetical protein
MVWNQVEKVTFSNVAATQGPFTLRGGDYAVAAAGTITSVKLQTLGGDGSTYVDVMSALTGSGLTTNLSLPAGTYQLAIVGSGVYASVTSIFTTQ